MTRIVLTMGLLLGLLALPGQASAQRIKNPAACNMGPVNMVRDSIDKMTQTQVNAFLLTFDSRCQQVIEFSESSNTMLFKLLMTKPDMVIHAIDNNIGVNIPVIMDELKEPFLEPDYAKLFSALQAVNTKSKTKSDLIHAVSEARSDR